MSWFGDNIGRIGAGVATLGLSEVANEVSGGGIWGGDSTVLGLGDVLRGEEDPGVADKYLDLDPSLRRNVEQGRNAQSQGLGLYSDELKRLKGVDPKQLAGVVQAKQEKQLLGQGKDQRRRAQQLVAQRGLNRSSVGLNAMLNAGTASDDKIAQSRAEQPLLQEKIASQRLGSIGAAQQGINQSLGAQGAQRDFVQGREGGGRSGGLMGLAGGLFGAYAGGPQGAYAGQQLGQGLANF
jgi:hypothetical protein